MKERQERIEWLAKRWLEAQATDAEERELRDWFRQTNEIPASLRELQVLFGGLDALTEEELAGTPEIRPIRRISPLWGIAAAAAIVFGLFVCAELLRKPYCYIDGEAVYDKEVAMQTTVYFESFSAFDASSRMVDDLIRNN